MPTLDHGVSFRYNLRHHSLVLNSSSLSCARSNNSKRLTKALMDSRGTGRTFLRWRSLAVGRGSWRVGKAFKLPETTKPIFSFSAPPPPTKIWGDNGLPPRNTQTNLSYFKT